MGRIIRNAIKCLECGSVIESRHRHDFKTCACGACFVDGGKAYLRRGFKREDQFEDLSVVEHDGPTIEDENNQWTTADMFEEEKSA